MFMFMYSEPKNKGVVLIITQIETNFDNIMWRVQVSTSGLSFHSVRYCVNPIGTSSCFSYTRRTAPLSFPHCLFLWRCQTKVSTTYDFFKKNDLTPLFAARTICLAHSTHVNTLSSYPTHPFSCFLVFLFCGCSVSFSLSLKKHGNGYVLLKQNNNILFVVLCVSFILKIN